MVVVGGGEVGVVVGEVGGGGCRLKMKEQMVVVMVDFGGERGRDGGDGGV